MQRAFFGVDAPDFNLDLEADLRAAGIRTVHFICPAIWAWRPERVEKIRRSVDHVLCIFPFEPELLARHGIASTYVGHPLAHVIPLEPDKAAARAALGLPPGAQVVALLPGSRAAEVKYLARRFFEAARLMRRERPGLQFVVPAIPALADAIRQAARQAGLAEGPGEGPGGALTIVTGQSHTVLAACDVTLIASGTATLEAALFKRPMVIAYNMNGLSWLITRRKKLQPWVGLPNILCGDFVVPELLQEAATPEALARTTLAWFDQPETITALQQKFTELHHELRRDTAALATDAIQKVLES